MNPGTAGRPYHPPTLLPPVMSTFPPFRHETVSCCCCFSPYLDSNFKYERRQLSSDFVTNSYGESWDSVLQYTEIKI